MKIPTDEQITRFLDCIVKKVQEQGGKPEDLAHFFASQEHRYYEEVTNTIASNTIWLTPKPKLNPEDTEIVVDYNPYSFDEEIHTDENRVTIKCRILKYFSPKIDIECTRQEHLHLQCIEGGDYPKRIRESGEKNGLKACTIFHAFAIKKRADTDVEFRRKISPFLPIRFLGAAHQARWKDGGHVKVYIALDMRYSDRYPSANRPRVEDPPIAWSFNALQGHICRGSAAFY